MGEGLEKEVQETSLGLKGRRGKERRREEERSVSSDVRSLPFLYLVLKGTST